MTKEFTVPATVGELVKILQQYPQDAELAIFGTEIYDNGSIWEQETRKFRIQDFVADGVEEKYPVFITMANGYTLAAEEHA